MYINSFIGPMSAEVREKTDAQEADPMAVTEVVEDTRTTYIPFNFSI
jgi:hypothetical protein